LIRIHAGRQRPQSKLRTNAASDRCPTPHPPIKEHDDDPDQEGPLHRENPYHGRAIDAEVDLGMTGDGYFLQARLNVHLPGLRTEVAQAIVDAAHQTCPYSKATRGNIDVTVALV
jgi:hypothetical protein